MKSDDLKTARFYPFEHEPVPDSCWSMITGPDGRVYASSCCEMTPGGSVSIVRYNDDTDSLDTVVNVAKVVGEALDSGKGTQCKIHYSFASSPNNDILYAATHLSAPGLGRRYYHAWADYKDQDRAFPHSVVLAYDTGREEVLWHSVFIPREGCRCMALDPDRGKLYAISYPRDHFWIFDIGTREIRDLGRLGSVNSQGIFTDRKGRVFTTNGSGQLVRYLPDEDRLEELPIYLPHHSSVTSWHTVIYDVVASPDGDCVYGIPWDSNPHLFRYWPDDGRYGCMENLGPVHQERDVTHPVAFLLDHCGGLVFGADGMLYYATSRWNSGDELRMNWEFPIDTEGVVVQMNTETLEKRDFARLQEPTQRCHYVSRAARDSLGNLFFGQVPRPIPAGISRLQMDAKGENLHLPIRTWG